MQWCIIHLYATIHTTVNIYADCASSQNHNNIMYTYIYHNCAAKYKDDMFLKSVITTVLGSHGPLKSPLLSGAT